MASDEAPRAPDPRLRDLSELNETLRRARQTLSQDGIRRTLLDFLHALGFDRVTFLHLDRDGEQLRGVDVKDHTNLRPDLTEVRFPLRREEALLTLCRTAPGAFRIARGAAGAPVTRFFDFFAADELGVMPVVVKTEVAGLIVVDNVFSRRPISDEAVRTLGRLAAEAGLALENALLFESARDATAAEEIGLVLNRRRILEKVGYEMGRARRYDRPLSVALMDIDRFEAFLESFGHGAGDGVLQEVARAVKQTSRDVDHIGRCGAEQFLAVLPETGAKNVLLYAERVRVAVERLGARLQASYPGSAITVSVGVASFARETDADADSLVARAQRALQEACDKGRNCCCKG